MPEPSTSVQVLCEWPGWWCSAEKDQLLQAMGRELDFKKRYALWERVQALFYADAARIKFGDYFRLPCYLVRAGAIVAQRAPPTGPRRAHGYLPIKVSAAP